MYSTQSASLIYSYFVAILGWWDYTSEIIELKTDQCASAQKQRKAPVPHYRTVFSAEGKFQKRINSLRTMYNKHTNASISCKLSVRWVDREYSLHSYKMAGTWCCPHIREEMSPFVLYFLSQALIAQGILLLLSSLSVSNFRAFIFWLCWISCARR